MTTTDKKPPEPRKLVPQKIGPVDKRRRPRGLTKAIRTAIDAIVFDRCTREEGCKRAGITERALYLALAKPEVAAAWNAKIVVLRSGERARNIHALAEVRDGTNAVARVNAVRTLESMSEEESRRPPGHVTMPGMTIQIITAPALPAGSGHAIDITPAIDHANILPTHDDEAR